MPDAAGQVLATRVAFLELQDERRLVQEGYELLDEKRMLLATEIMRQLRRNRELGDRLAAEAEAARTAFDGAVDACGFDDLTVHPRLGLETSLLHADVPAVPRPDPARGHARGAGARGGPALALLE